MPGYQRPGPPPTQALEYLRRKGNKTAFDYREVWKEQHAQSFTVAKVLEGDLLIDIRKAVDQALAEGVPFAEFKKRLEPVLEAKGWKGYGMLRGEDGDPILDGFGNPQEFELGTPRRLKTIYDTNLRQTRGAAQWTKAQDTREVLPYFRYTLGPSRDHRAEHASWSDLVLLVDDPFWDTHYPINGWGCKCRVIPVTKRKAAKLGGPHQAPKFERLPWLNKETGLTELVPEGIDPGFDYNPGKAAGGKIKQIAKEKADKVKKVVGTKAKPAPLPEWETFKQPDRLDIKARGLRIADGILGAQSKALAESLAYRGKTIGETLKAIDIDDPRLLAVAKEFQAELLSRLDVAQGIGRKAQIANGGQAKKIIERASSKYPASWVEAADNAGPLFVKFSKARGWASTISSPRGHKEGFGWAYKQPGSYLPHLDTTGASPKWKKGTGFITTDASSTAEHEFGHRIQETNPGLDRVFQEEHRARTQGDPLRRLRDITNINYGANEITREDGYYNAYQGREYHHPANKGKEALEVLTMSLEPLLGEMNNERTAKKLKQFIAEDKDLVNLAIGLLFHYNPKGK